MKKLIIVLIFPLISFGQSVEFAQKPLGEYQCGQIKIIIDSLQNVKSEWRIPSAKELKQIFSDSAKVNKYFNKTYWVSNMIGNPSDPNQMEPQEFVACGMYRDFSAFSKLNPKFDPNGASYTYYIRLIKSK